MLPALILGLALAQQPAPTVTLIFPNRTVTVTVTEAERRLATETDLSWQVALTHALGTRPALDEPTHKPLTEMTATERSEHERRRWKRLAAQAQ